MKLNNQVKSFTLIYLVISCYLISISSTLVKVMFQSQRRKLKVKGPSTDAADGALDKTNVVATCMKAMMDTIPPEFCLNVGSIPKECPPTYPDRKMALCYKACDNHYVHFLGVCWEKCKADHKDHGATCFKGIFDWYFKKSYIPESITNFNNDVKCPKGQTKPALSALCYPDCKQILMEKCDGIPACGRTQKDCTQSVFNIILDVLLGLAQLTMFIISLGTSSTLKAAKATLTTSLKTANKQGIKAGWNVIRNQLTTSARKAFFAKAQSFLKDKVVGKLKDNLLTTACETIWNAVADKAEKQGEEPDTLPERLAKSLDIFNIAGVVDDCAKIENQNDSIKCANSVLSGVSMFDPTGLLTVITAFLKPQCAHVGEEIDFKQEQGNVSNTALAKVTDSCIILFEECYFQGKGRTVCMDTPYIHDFNDKASSLLVGKKASGVLFEHANYQGRHLPFGENNSIPCFLDVKRHGWDLNNLTSSVMFKADKCAIIHYRAVDPTQLADASTNIILCDTQEDVNKEIPQNLEYISTYLFRTNVKIVLYSEPLKNKAKGTSWSIENGHKFENKKPPFNKIRGVEVSK